jgi:N-acetylglucosaminyldiphosphoundecaprenol N-acetyl-beta-D-mannosaminyltransferase
MLSTKRLLERTGVKSTEAVLPVHNSSGGPGDLPDALSRQVYCILGVPIDLITMPGVLRRIETAACAGRPFTLSTPNLNFLVMSQSDAEFRETLLLSDLCPADGIPILWIARLLGVPIKQRIAGSDIFDALKSSSTPLKLFFFGGAEGVASAAARALNSGPGGLRCVGTLDPGFCSVEDMSRGDIIDQVNACGAEFLVASLGARKGQLWLQRNFDRIRVPIRAHLGAAVNFQAGAVRRAPAVMRKWGLEWLWRIKEEPHLCRRYLKDGTILLRLLFTSVVPLTIRSLYLKLKGGDRKQDLSVTLAHDAGSATVFFSGSAVARHVEQAITVLREAIADGKRIKIDLSHAREIDARFLGLLLMVRKTLKDRGAVLTLTRLSPSLELVFRLNRLNYLLREGRGPARPDSRMLPS